MHEGTIKTIVADRHFGFIAVAGMKDVFFHGNDLCDSLEFDKQLTERRVRFSIEQSAKGPRAIDVMPAD